MTSYETGWAYDQQNRTWRAPPAGTLLITNQQLDINAVRTGNIQAAAVTTAKIADGNVTAAKIASEAWTDWVPTLTNMTLGNGTVLARYVKIGRLVNARFTFTLGTTSAMGTEPRFSLPFTPHASVVGRYIGTCYMTDVTTNIFTGFVQGQGASDALMRISGAAGAYVNFNQITATVPFTWASTYSIDAMVTYEAAS